MHRYHVPTDAAIAASIKAIILADLTVYDSIAGLAAKAGTNPFKVRQVFKKYYGVSVFQFSRQARIERAKSMLTETNCTLQTIAEEVGYSEGNNFQASFKAVVGCTPGEWRRSMNEWKPS